MSESFIISNDSAADEPTINVSGEIDMLTAPQFQETLNKAAENRPPTIRLNLENVSFFDSSGIRVLVETAQKLQPYSGRLILTGASPSARKVLEISGVLGEVIYDES